MHFARISSTWFSLFCDLILSTCHWIFPWIYRFPELCRTCQKITHFSWKMPERNSRTFQDLKGAMSQIRHLEKIGQFFQVCHSQSVLIFSILNHPCSCMVYYYLFGVFLPKLNLVNCYFEAFFNLKVILSFAKMKISWHRSFKALYEPCNDTYLSRRVVQLATSDLSWSRLVGS